MSEALDIIMFIVQPIVLLSGFIVVIIQNHRTKRLDVCKFLYEAEVHFSNNNEIQSVYRKLSAKHKALDKNNTKEKELTGRDIDGISAYLTFFETFLPYVKNRFLNCDVIDNQFGYRFFIAVHDEYIQKEEIFKDEHFYSNLLELYDKWYKHRKTRNKHIPLDERRLDISGNKKTGFVINNNKSCEQQTIHVSKQSEKAPIYTCSKQDLGNIIDAQEIIINNLIDKDIFIGTDCNTIKEYLSDDSSFAVFGIYDDVILCAYLFMIYVSFHSESLNRYAENVYGMTADSKVATLDSVAVLPQYRGKSYQRYLVNHACEIAKKKGFDFLMTGVSLRNCISISNMASEGFFIHTITKLHGKDRVILCKPLCQEL